MRLPMLFTNLELSMRMKEYGYAIDRADRLIAISDYERENLRHFYGKTNVSVVPLSGFGAEEYLEYRGASTSRTKLSNKPYLIYPAVPWAHKNHEALIQAIAVLKCTGRHVRLVLTNTDADVDSKQRLIDLCDSFGLRDSIDLMGFVSELELITLMRGSLGMVFPSLYEGFGIPLVDALKLEVPILVSEIGAAREICGTSANYFRNSRNAISLALDVWQFWTDREQRERNVLSGRQRGELFSSRRMAEGIVDAAKHAISSRSHQPSLPVISTPLRAERGMLSLLLFVHIGDLTNDVDLASSIREMVRELGSQVDVTIAVDVSILATDGVLGAFDQFERVILYRENSIEARSLAVREFARRHNGGEFHIVIEWSEREKFGFNQLAAMIHGLRHNLQAGYAVIDSALRNVTIADAPTELQIIRRYENLRLQGGIVNGVMFRCEGLFQENRHGTVQFLSAYCSEGSYLRVPVVGAHHP
ncbi:hypothetical protein N185_08670 [Sinorhizobium sp. GW3]|nr:hypothetical protein N185_08670 [Sinorhizobium sp. GW3]